MHKSNKLSRFIHAKESGFTLVELLVVISIIALLAGLALPALNRARMEGYKVQDVNNLKQIGLSISLYSNDYSGQFPVKWDAAKSQGDIDPKTDAPNNSNEAFRALFGTGILKDERVFFTQGWTRVKKGDNDLGSSPEYSKALERRENAYSYIVGFSQGSNPIYPLAANPWVGGLQHNENDGFSVPGTVKQLFNGTGINVLRVDGSVTWVPAAANQPLKLGGAGEQLTETITPLSPDL
jgi:prepilin-type N-terminal cleavage/methylation domain-containing protein